MSRDVGDAIGAAVGRAAREAAKSVSHNAKKASNGRLSGTTGLAAGAGLAALAPIAVRGAGRLVKRGLSNGTRPIEKIGDKVGGGLKDAVSKKVDDAGGAAGIVKDAGKDMIPGMGDGKSTGAPGVGKGRRMPVQQAIDVAVPVKTAYNQWTQFEDWPKFMHRIERASQEDECHVSFKTKIWGISKEFTAEILDQKPDERIKWRVTDGVSHTGVVTFHELSDRLTRVDVTLDVHPGSLIEKAGRGMRHVKRAVRADLSRFKAYMEMEAEESGAWRGVIDDGKVKSKRTGSSSSGGQKKPSRAKASSSSRSSRAASSGGSRKASGSRSSSGSGSGSSSGSSGSGSSGGASGSGSRSRSSNGSTAKSSNRSRASSNGKSSGSSRKKAASSRS